VGIFGRKETRPREEASHRVEVLTFDDDDDPAFVAMCTCGRVSPPFPTKDDATGWGRDHGVEVAEQVRVLTDEGGTGWQCMFCGSVVEQAPLRISVSWTDEGVDGEQWYAAHRACLVERLSAGEQFAPRFLDPGGEGQSG
jgi:hypothetical protein